jgi:hypothetical protein
MAMIETTRQRYTDVRDDKPIAMIERTRQKRRDISEDKHRTK